MEIKKTQIKVIWKSDATFKKKSKINKGQILQNDFNKSMILPWKILETL